MCLSYEHEWKSPQERLQIITNRLTRVIKNEKKIDLNIKNKNRKKDAVTTTRRPKSKLKKHEK